MNKQTVIYYIRCKHLPSSSLFTWKCDTLLYVYIIFGLNSSSCISIPGENCEVSSRSGRCVSGVCKNGGQCVDLLVGGFMCQCPEGAFEKPYCQMSTRSFPGNAFVTFRGLRQRFHFTLSFMWVPLPVCQCGQPAVHPYSHVRLVVI